jgi:hypothetical protein
MTRQDPIPPSRRRWKTWPALFVLGALVFAQLAWAAHAATHAADDPTIACAWCAHAKPAVAPGAVFAAARSAPVVVTLAVAADDACARTPGRLPPPARAPPATA